MQNYIIKKISEVDNSQLFEFYKATFKNRHKSLINNLKWCYRIGHNKSEPIVLIIKNKLIGHAGLIPVDLSIEGSKKSAIWFTDLAILPEFQNKGFGQILTKEWMKICPTHITFCNNKSLKVFKKYGWQNNLDTKRFITPINYFKITPVVNKLGINFGDKVIRQFFKKRINIKSTIQPQNIDEKIIVNLANIEKKNDDNLAVKIIRDEEWFNWRLIECPFKREIFLFENNNNYIIAHIFNSNNLKRLNIVYLHSEKSDSDILEQVFKWSLENNIDFMWYINNTKSNVDRKIAFSFKKSLNFAYNSFDKNIFNSLKNGLSNSQGIDSDIESITNEG